MVVGIQSMLLDVLIDPHLSNEDKQCEDGLVSKHAIDVVTLWKSDARCHAARVLQLNSG